MTQIRRGLEGRMNEREAGREREGEGKVIGRKGGKIMKGTKSGMNE